MKKTVDFRKFEERDIEFVFKCKNDEKLNSLVVGNYHPLSYTEAEEWVRNCMKGDRPDLKFWAICTNDAEKKIIGWVSISEIDMDSKTSSFNGIVIADPAYHDGFAWIESYLFIYDYTFEQLGMEKVFGAALTDHIVSQTMRKIMYTETLEVVKNAVYRNGRSHDVSKSVLTRDNYFKHKNNGDYELKSIIGRIREAKKEALMQI